jgi:hypothetical protein
VEPIAATAGTTPIVVSIGGTRTLAPGNYSSVLIRDRGTLSLSTGKYTFTSLTASNDARIRVSAANGPVTVVATGAVSMGDRVGVTATGGLDYPLFLYGKQTVQLGHDGTYEMFASALQNINVQDRSDIIGCLQSNGSVTIGSDATLLQPDK